MRWRRTTEEEPPVTWNEELLGVFAGEEGNFVYRCFWFEPAKDGFCAEYSDAGEPIVCEVPVFWSYIDPHPAP